MPPSDEFVIPPISPFDVPLWFVGFMFSAEPFVVIATGGNGGKNIVLLGGG